MKVRYQDGVTSTDHVADLEIGPTGLRIHYVDGLGSLQEVYWAADTLAPALVESNRPIFLRRKGQNGPYLRFESMPDFTQVLLAYPTLNLVQGRTATGQFSNGRQTSKIIGIVALGMVVLGLTAYAAFASIGQLATVLLPIKWDVKAGKVVYQQMKDQEQVTENKEASALAQAFYKEAGFKSRFPIEVHVDKSTVVNAYALPGGQIILNQGLIAKAEEPEELAGVLAHEMGHVEKRHTFQHLARMSAVYLGVSALIGDVTGIMAVLIDNGQSILGLTYSRKMELEADQFALNQLLTHQINPEGLPDFFSKLEEEEADKGTDKIPAIFKTHPATPERIEELEADIPDDYTVDPDRKERLASLFKSLREAIGAPQEDIDLELDSLDVHVDGDSSHFNMHVRVRE